LYLDFVFISALSTHGRGREGYVFFLVFFYARVFFICAVLGWCFGGLLFCRLAFLGDCQILGSMYGRFIKYFYEIGSFGKIFMVPLFLNTANFKENFVIKTICGSHVKKL
jgi:hypothetical protein